MTDTADAVSVRHLARCFEGAVPAVIATASADGVPNVTYLSRVAMVDDTHVALSNQFFSKTSRNLAENPRASVLVLDPHDYDQWRLTLTYERTERRGSVFERLRSDIDALAALVGMQDVFRLRTADIYRVVGVEPVLAAVHRLSDVADRVHQGAARTAADPRAVAELVTRLGRSPDLDALVTTTVRGLASSLGYEHSFLMLLSEDGRSLYTIASHGYDAEGVGSEIAVGEGLTGMAAAQAKPMRIGNLGQMRKYSRRLRRSYEEHGAVGPGREIPLPGLPDAQSRVAVPAVALGEVVGVLVVEDVQPVAFDDADEAALGVVAAVVAHAAELERTRDLAAGSTPADIGNPRTAPPSDDAATAVSPATLLRFFPADGSTFIDGDYLIKGVAGRILWSLASAHQAEGRVDFTNREVRLDPSLELPPFKDNFESRLILLKRRLDERDAPVRIEKTGRGRFRLVVSSPLRLEEVRGSV